LCHIKFDHFHIIKSFTHQGVLYLREEEKHMGPCLVSMVIDAAVACGVWLKIGSEFGPHVLILCQDEFSTH
jgi:hypothetical protein